MKQNPNSARLKGIALALLLLCLCLVLAACYVPPDDTSSGSQNVSGNNAVHFDTVQPTASPSPVPTATPTPEPMVTPTQGTTGGYSTWTDPNATAGSGTDSGWQTVVTNPPIQDVTPRPATPTPTATPAPTTLRRGSSGDDVRNLQQRLKALGYYDGAVDGSYGAGTEAAVKAFQSRNGLAADGKAGEKTQALLYSTNAVAATATPRVTATPRITATPRPTSTPRTNIYLQSGSSGDNVRKLQNKLIELGYLGGTATGRYSGATIYAVKAFQRRNGLYDDGKAGPQTLEKLYSGSAKKASQMAATVGEALYEGESGDAVRAMQRRLKELGYLSGSVDGSYGPKTTEAVRNFQQSNGLTPSGSATTQTLELLYSDDAMPFGEGYVPADAPYVSASSEALAQGQSGDDVAAMQRRLQELGYYTGPITGEYDAATATAVMAFQTSRNIDADGAAGPETLNAMYDDDYTVTYTALREGDSGQKVRTLQQALYELGYYTGGVDGRYGSGTTDAVVAFQTRNGIPVTGYADEGTLEVLYSSNAVEAPSPTGSYVTLRPGDSGEDVWEMKDILLQLGYSPSDNSLYDTQTEEAVKAFQRRNGLTVDGIAGPATLKRLYSADAIAAE